MTLQLSKNTQRNLVSNVTAETYPEIGSAVIGMYGGAVICIAAKRVKNIDYPATPEQWGAWRAYFKSRGIPLAFMDAQAKAENPFTVPAPWPHEFDADAAIADDHAAGQAFMRNYRPARIDVADTARRLATVKAWRDGRIKPTPKDHLVPPLNTDRQWWQDDSGQPSDELRAFMRKAG